MKKLLFILGLCFSINASAMTFQAIEDGEICGYFAGAIAGYDSKLSLSIDGIQSDTFYSMPSLNPDGLDHMRYAQHGDFLFIGFEDLLNDGALDFDDNNAFFTNISAVPEPDSYMLFLVGLLLISFLVKQENYRCE